jgi:predicted transcriptional regulator
MAESDSSPLTMAQREIMEVVWAKVEVTVTEVRDALEKKRDLARNTVQTMMVRLEERGWLQHREQGRTFIYSAARPKTVSLGAKVSQMVDRLFAGSPEDLVNALIEYRGLSIDESERIRGMIEKAESKKRGGKS